MADRYNLQRFVDAQADIYTDVTTELRRGRKTSHWMWFIFPQIQGLGHSFMAREYAISSLEEAAAYLAHPVLGARLRECCQLVLDVQGRTANQIFGSPDDMKLRSCITLFSRAAGSDQIFQQVLDKYFQGKPDALTLAKLEA